ncbi:hypothetical protein Q8F55_001629 [Vanrija albida]|uniref:GDP/GTP exchange factor Sec2 N-terminal domain-containing protein n=1 Tax=Vanrija albida TaxID=181172 RepID=A0ABR3QGJ2_9TREE
MSDLDDGRVAGDATTAPKTGAPSITAADPPCRTTATTPGATRLEGAAQRRSQVDPFARSHRPVKEANAKKTDPAEHADLLKTLKAVDLERDGLVGRAERAERQFGTAREAFAEIQKSIETKDAQLEAVNADNEQLCGQLLASNSASHRLGRQAQVFYDRWRTAVAHSAIKEEEMADQLIAEQLAAQEQAEAHIRDFVWAFEAESAASTSALGKATASIIGPTTNDGEEPTLDLNPAARATAPSPSGGDAILGEATNTGPPESPLATTLESLLQEVRAGLHGKGVKRATLVVGAELRAAALKFHASQSSHDVGQALAGEERAREKMIKLLGVLRSAAAWNEHEMEVLRLVKVLVREAHRG